MKILHVVDSIHEAIGGPARSVTSLADAMAEAGEEATVLANDYQGLGPSQKTRLARRRLVPARRMPLRTGAWSPGLKAALAEEIRRADIVHSHGIWLRTNHLAAQLARANGKPYFVSPRGMLENWSARHRSFRKAIVWTLIEKRLLQKAHALHATSGEEKSTLEKLQLGRPVVVSPNGIDLPDTPPSRELIESRFPFFKNRRILLFLSRLHPKKGLDDLLAVWSEVGTRHPDWLLVISGDDFDGRRAGYEALARQSGISPKQVHFTGHLNAPEKWSALAACELFVLPSHSENFGLVIGEALAAGKPIITTTATPWSWIQETNCGWWIEPSRPALQQTLEQALALPAAKLAEMGSPAPALIKSRFNWNAVCRILLAAYRDALAS